MQRLVCILPPVTSEHHAFALFLRCALPILFCVGCGEHETAPTSPAPPLSAPTPVPSPAPMPVPSSAPAPTPEPTVGAPSLESALIGNVGVRIGGTGACEVPEERIAATCPSGSAAPATVTAAVQSLLRRGAANSSSITSESQSSLRITNVHVWAGAADIRGMQTHFPLSVGYDSTHSGYRDARGCRGEACNNGSWNNTTHHCVRLDIVGEIAAMSFDNLPPCLPGVGRLPQGSPRFVWSRPTRPN